MMCIKQFLRLPEHEHACLALAFLSKTVKTVPHAHGALYVTLRAKGNATFPSSRPPKFGNIGIIGILFVPRLLYETDLVLVISEQNDSGRYSSSTE